MALEPNLQILNKAVISDFTVVPLPGREMELVLEQSHRIQSS